MPKLRHIWNGSLNNVRSMRVLEISGCDAMMYVVTAPLRNLERPSAHQIEFSSLENLCIQFMMKFEGILHITSDVATSTAGNDILFPQLNTLTFKHCPTYKLAREFCNLLELSSMSITGLDGLKDIQELTVKHCDSLVELSHWSMENLVVPKLHTLFLNGEEIVVDGNLKATLQRLKMDKWKIKKWWPKTLKHILHQEHDLELMTTQRYHCNKCRSSGRGYKYSFTCLVCEFDLHPTCALKDLDTELLEEPPEFKVAKEWPKELQHELHEDHKLQLTLGREYICDACNQDGSSYFFSFSCIQHDCDFNLHPRCALDESLFPNVQDEEDEEDEEKAIDIDQPSSSQSFIPEKPIHAATSSSTASTIETLSLFPYSRSPLPNEDETTMSESTQTINVLNPEEPDHELKLQTQQSTGADEAGPHNFPNSSTSIAIDLKESKHELELQTQQFTDSRNFPNSFTSTAVTPSLSHEEAMQRMRSEMEGEYNARIKALEDQMDVQVQEQVQLQIQNHMQHMAAMMSGFLMSWGPSPSGPISQPAPQAPSGWSLPQAHVGWQVPPTVGLGWQGPPQHGPLVAPSDIISAPTQSPIPPLDGIVQTNVEDA